MAFGFILAQKGVPVPRRAYVWIEFMTSKNIKGYLMPTLCMKIRINQE